MSRRRVARSFLCRTSRSYSLRMITSSRANLESQYAPFFTSLFHPEWALKKRGIGRRHDLLQDELLGSIDVSSTDLLRVAK